MKSQLEDRAARMSRNELKAALSQAVREGRHRMAEVLDEERCARAQDHADRESGMYEQDDPSW